MLSSALLSAIHIAPVAFCVVAVVIIGEFLALVLALKEKDAPCELRIGPLRYKQGALTQCEPPRPDQAAGS